MTSYDELQASFPPDEGLCQGVLYLLVYATELPSKPAALPDVQVICCRYAFCPSLNEASGDEVVKGMILDDEIGAFQPGDALVGLCLD